MAEFDLTAEERASLLRFARATITAAVTGRPLPEFPPAELTPALCAPHAAFVTIRRHGQLRGCIGLMDYRRPLWQNVARAAVSAALEDSRFPPVSADELADLTVEISVLEPPRRIARPEDYDASRHGIIVQRGWYHALLLPKVAREYGWGREQMLDAVCEKAGLPARAWREPGTQLEVFTALEFGEED